MTFFVGRYVVDGHVPMEIVRKLSPWIFRFSSDFATHTSWMAAEEWCNLAIGLWVAVCSWILGFGTAATAMHVHLVMGLSVAALVTAALWRVHAAPHAR